MRYYEAIHNESVEGFDIELSVTPEDEWPDWDFQSEEDKLEVFRKIENGFYAWFVVKVTASKNGIELASDYLGGNLYDKASDFVADEYYSDMVKIVIKEAKEVIQKLTEQTTN